MAESTANVSYGITFSYTPEGGAEEFTGEVTDITKDPETTDQADVTHQESPDMYREFIPGLTDPGSLMLGLNFDSDKAPPPAGTKGVLVMTLPPAWGATLDTCTMTGSPATRDSFDGPLGDKVSSEVSFKLSGKPVWSDATP